MNIFLFKIKTNNLIKINWLKILSYNFISKIRYIFFYLKIKLFKIKIQ